MHKNNILQQGGEYKIERSIASGGFCCTYEAHHTLSDTLVAMKEFFNRRLLPIVKNRRDRKCGHAIECLSLRSFQVRFPQGAWSQFLFGYRLMYCDANRIIMVKRIE